MDFKKGKEITKVFEDTARIYRNDASPDNVADYYSSWAPVYEKGYHLDGVYTGPRLVAQTLGNVYKENRETVRVLDVAAGTGIVGEELYNLGFRQLDGLDPAQGMLELCRRKNLYNKLICEFITENPSTIPADTYDCIGSSGGMGAGHIPRGALREMIRIIKPGGHICIIMRVEFIEHSEEYNNNKLENTMRQHELSGLWKKVERRTVDNYFCGKEGVLFLYQVL